MVEVAEVDVEVEDSAGGGGGGFFFSNKDFLVSLLTFDGGSLRPSFFAQRKDFSFANSIIYIYKKKKEKEIRK